MPRNPGHGDRRPGAGSVGGGAIPPGPPGGVHARAPRPPDPAPPCRGRPASSALCAARRRAPRGVPAPAEGGAMNPDPSNDPRRSLAASLARDLEELAATLPEHPDDDAVVAAHELEMLEAQPSDRTPEW